MQAEAIRQEICEVGRLLYEHKLVAASEGNISVRLDEGEILINKKNTVLSFFSFAFSI